MYRLRNALSYQRAGPTAPTHGRAPLPPYDRLSEDREPPEDASAADFGRGIQQGNDVWRNWARGVAICVISLLFGILLARSDALRRYSACEDNFATEAGVWADYGQVGEVRVGTKPLKVLEPCKRTLLLQWSRYGNGLGSLVTAAMQTVLFAKEHDYDLLFSREANAYGAFLDSFTPHEPRRCRVTDDMHNAGYDVQLHDVTSEAWRYRGPPRSARDVDRLAVAEEDILLVNQWIRNNTYGNLSELESLPSTSAFAPIPAPATVPRLFRQRFLQYSAVAAEYFQLNPKVLAVRDTFKWNLGLEGPSKRPVIGVHFRGGDKITLECLQSPRLSCGNITVHCIAALDALTTFAPSFPLFLPSTAKARLLLMSAEPNAPELFAADPLCARHFDVESFAHGGTRKPFEQPAFQAMRREDRLEDTHRFLAGIDILANWVDAAVVSANSNAGRLILVHGGPARVIKEQRIRSVDVPWHPLHWTPHAGYCDGTFKCFPPA